MEKEFVTYEIALKLKELGFDEKCFGYYSQNDTNDMHYLGIYQEEDYFLSGDVPSIVGPEAPLWQQAIDWFRKRHNMWIIISKKDEHFDNEIEFRIIPNRGDSIYKDEFRSFRKAREKAILKAIKLYQEKHNKNGI